LPLNVSSEVPIPRISGVIIVTTDENMDSPDLDFLTADDDLLGVEQEGEDDGDIEDTDKTFVDCTCECTPAEHDEDGCTNCIDCDGHWE
jgi:hypothetical protein